MAVIQHTSPCQDEDASAWRVVEPTLSPRQFRAAVIEPDGRTKLHLALASAFEQLNSTSGAEARRRTAIERRPIVRREWRRAARHLGGTKPNRIIISRATLAERPFFSNVDGIGLLIGAVVALCCNHSVLSAYIVASGNDLYAADRMGARLFAVLAFLAALGVKAYEKRLPTDAAKHWYATAFLAAGLASFVIWAVAGALLFAPKAAATSWLTQGSAAPWVPVALMIAHILGDCSWGYILFSGAEQLFLGNCQRLVVANPEYPLAEARARKAQLALNACLDEIADAEAYLQAVAQCRLKLRAKAELELDRMAVLWRESQAAAVAYARATFLNTRDDR